MTRLVVAAWVIVSALAADAQDAGFGTYRLVGHARVQVSPFPMQDQPGDVKATVEPTGEAGRVSVRLESQGYTCVLTASRTKGSALEFSTPAHCAVDVREPDARGRVDARLRSGHGSLRDGRLALELVFDVSGNVATRMARPRLNLFGADVVVPEGWTPAVPVSGTVSSSASGQRRP